MLSLSVFVSLCAFIFWEFSKVCKGVANSMDVHKLELQSFGFPTTACFGGMNAL